MALGWSASGVGGSSSSSSNLSALAPPFTVGRLNPKPNSNPLLKYTGGPIPWQYPSDNRSDVYPKLDLGVDGSTRTTSMPLSDDYCYSGSDSINPASSQWSGLNYVAKESVNPSNTHHHWSGVKSPTNSYYGAEEAGNPSINHWSTFTPTTKSSTGAFSYSPAYVSPMIGKDTPVMSHKESVCGNVSSKDDYTESLSGLEYVTQWGGGGVWDSGLAETKHETHTHTGPFSAKISDDKSLFSQNLGFLVESSGTQPFLESPQSDLFKEPSTNFFNYQKTYGLESYTRDSPPLMKPSRAVVIRAPSKGANSPAKEGNKPELSSKRKFKDSIASSQVTSTTNVLSGLTLSLDHIQASDSMDNLNPAEDSPCWKGAPTSQYSSLDHVEPLTQHQLLKRLEDCFNLEALGTKVNEYSENGTSTLNSNPSANEHVTCGVAYHVAEKVLGSPSAQETGPVPPNVKMDVGTLIKAIHNLSGLICFNCSIDSSALKEHDYEVLKNVISNLDSCLSKKMVNSNPAQAPALSPEQIFPRKDINEFDQDMAKFAEQGIGNFYGEFDHQNMPYKKVDYEPGKKAQDFIFSGENENERISSDDDDMVKAIQKVLDENFDFEEDLHPQSILFKNLWLEAEAKLCSISTRARFDRMKIQMKEHKPNISENVANLGKVSSGSNSSSDMKDTSTPVSQAKYKIDNKKPEGLFNGDDEASVLARLIMLKHRDEISNTEANSVNTSKPEGQFGITKSDVNSVGANDVEDSVLARFNMIKRRDEKFNLKEPEGESFEREGNDDSSFSTKSKVDDMNASVLARLSILKLRDDKNSEDVVDTRKTESEFGTGVCGYESMKEFCLSVVNDPVILPDRNGRFGNQASSSGTGTGTGWYENSSSDWEHVLKDEFLWQK